MSADRVRLETPLADALKPAMAKKFASAFGYETVGDLLWHLPRRYYDRGELTDLAALQIGETVTIVATVQRFEARDIVTGAGKRLHITQVTLTDGAAELDVTFFNQRFLHNKLSRGLAGLFSGTVAEYQGRRTLTNPEYELFDSEADADSSDFLHGPVPVYAATSTLKTRDIRERIRDLLRRLDDASVPDIIPDAVHAEHSILPLARAFRAVHMPSEEAEVYRGLHSLRWQEALTIQTYLLATRSWLHTLPSTPRPAGKLLAEFDRKLPFELTNDQRSVGDEIRADLASSTSMHRLVQGEVGSGKTLVALRAMLQVADGGGQSALLAPTEVLAVQHLQSITRSLGPELAERIHPVLITGQLSASERNRAALAAAAGKALIVVGTHALLSESTQFHDLGLVVIDEQHRFGVAQREALRNKGVQPHTLVLTATPIPRTIAITAFGALDVSTIKTMPASRAGIASFAVQQRSTLFDRVWLRLAEEAGRGRQAFVVCPAIEPGKTEAGATLFDDDSAIVLHDVRSTLEQLRRSPATSHLRMAPLTGAMPSDEKAATMRAFVAGDIDVLVATTVIEVGVDVPNATMMVVMDADRFGISQLHQLRGRVGRGEHGGLCMLVTRALPESEANERVAAVAATHDGFALAEIDLEQRREGDVLGTRQSGSGSQLKALRVTKDSKLLLAAREAAKGILAADPKLEGQPALRRAVAAMLDPEARAALFAF